MNRTHRRDSDEVYFEEDSDSEKQKNEKHTKFEQRKLMVTRFLEKVQNHTTNETTDENRKENSTEREEDPLDAFMADINKTLKEQEEQQQEQQPVCRLVTNEGTISKPPTTALFFRNDEVCEEEDLTADYLEDAAMKAATAKSAVEDDEDDDDDDAHHSRGASILPPVDHDTIEYKTFNKNLYKEHEDVTNMSIEKRLAYRESKQITVLGYQVPHAISTFEQLVQSLEKGLLMNVRYRGWNNPTPIQSQSIPVILSGRDLVAVAATGTGKTAAYLIPTIQHVCKVLDCWKIAQMPSQGGPIALIVCPTRELALQIFDVLHSLVQNLRLRVSCFVGGYDKTQQFKEINNGIEICIGNPGRLIDLGSMKNGLRFKDITFLVLDEADRMLDIGFVTEVLSITRTIRPDRQTVMFSATIPSDVEKLANVVTKRAVRVTIGKEGQASNLVDQKVIVFGSEQRKADWIVNNINKLIRWDRQLLVFCKSHGRVLDLSAVINDVLNSTLQIKIREEQQHREEEDMDIEDESENEHERAATSETVLVPAFARLSRSLCDRVASREDTMGLLIQQYQDKEEEGSIEPDGRKIYAKVLYGDMNQGERVAVLTAFRKRKFPILVATDVAARGLDIPSISVVLSYDAPAADDIHIHRIGRTGRSGTSGTAYTLLTRGENRIAGYVVESMEAVGQKVPRQLMQLATSYEPFRRAKLIGRSFSSHMKLNKAKKNGELHPVGPSSAGLGFAKVESITKSKKWTGSFVQSNSSNVTSTASPSDNERVKRRWDTNPESVASSNTIPPLSPFQPPEGPKRQRSTSFSSATTLHVETSIPQNAPKVFNPTDDIPSSDEDDMIPSSTVQPISSVLNLNKRHQRSTQNQLADAQQRVLAAVIAAKSTSTWDPSSSHHHTDSTIWPQQIPTTNQTSSNKSRKSRWD